MHATSYLRRFALSAALAIALVAGAFSPASAFLDKTRFLAHIGVAYFAFHHWVMNPYREGAFAQGAPHRTAAIVKGGVALLFAVHEVHVSEKIARKSKDPLLQKLDGAVAGLANSFTSVGQRMKAGQLRPGDVGALTSQTTTVGAQAAANGAPIKDVRAPVPGI